MPDNKQKIMLSNLMTNRMIATMCLACAALILVMGIRMGYSSSSTFLFFYNGCKVMVFVMLAAAVFGVVKYIVDRKKGRDTAMQVFGGLFIAAAALVFAFVFYKMAYSDYMAATRLLYLLIPAVAALYIIYLVYRHEFFAVAFFGALIALYIWRYARYNPGSTGFLIWQIVLLAALGACIVFFLCMERGGGTITAGGNRYRFFPENGVFIPVVIALSILFLLTAALFFIPGVYMMYCAYAAAALVFVYAVYFTVLML